MNFKRNKQGLQRLKTSGDQITDIHFQLNASSFFQNAINFCLLPLKILLYRTLYYLIYCKSFLYSLLYGQKAIIRIWSSSVVDTKFEGRYNNLRDRCFLMMLLQNL